MSQLKIAVIGGGSSYTPELMEGLIIRAKQLPVREVVFVDIESGQEKLAITTALAKRMVEKAGLDIIVHSTLDRRAAIKGADFVMTQFRVGGLQSREKDELIPLKHNVIGQETTGPGGFAKALRTIPVILGICRDIEELAPDAWLVNFTNPAAIVTEAALNHSKVKTVGLCNVPIGTQRTISKILDADPERVEVDFAGLNHMVWGHSVKLDGKDVTEFVLEKMCDGAHLNMQNISDEPWNPEFLKALGVVPCGYHRYFYLTEAMLKHEVAEAEGEGSRAQRVMKLEKELFELYQSPELKEKPKQLEKRGGAYYSDASLNLVDAIYNDKRDIQAVNVINNGAISNLPADAVVEINCVVGRDGAKPLNFGPLKPVLHTLAQQVKTYEQLTIEAAVTGDYDKALLALATNPLVPDSNAAKALLDDILEANREHLPQFNA